MPARSKNAKPAKPAAASLGENVEESPWVSPEVAAMLEGEVIEINQDLADLAPVTPYVAPDEDDAQDA